MGTVLGLNTTESVGNHAERSTRRRLLLGLALLFTWSLALRWTFAAGDFLGDEAWYFYLAKSFGREVAARVDHPWFHLANRPLYYLTFHLSTYGGIYGFRLFGAAVGALAPPLCFLAARALGVSLRSAALLALCLSFQRQHLEYAAHGFPDLLACDFALLACWAAARQRAWSTFLFATCCVLTKESFVMVPIIATLLRLTDADTTSTIKRPDLCAWLTICLPTAYVAGVTAVSLGVPDLKMQGWSATAFDLRHARNMWVGPELWPFIVWFAWRRQVRALALWLALPAFYLIWSKALGRGLAPWYSIGPAALSALALALMLDALRTELQRRRWPLRRVSFGLLVACLCLAPVPLLGALRVRAQLRTLHGTFPRPRIAPDVLAILHERRPTSVLVVNCFWAFGYSHLRAVDAPASRLYSSAPQEVAQAAHKNALTIVCHDEKKNTSFENALSGAGFDTLLNDAQWLVLAPSPRTP